MNFLIIILYLARRNILRVWEIAAAEHAERDAQKAISAAAEGDESPYYGNEFRSYILCYINPFETLYTKAIELLKGLPSTLNKTPMHQKRLQKMVTKLGSAATMFYKAVQSHLDY